MMFFKGKKVLVTGHTGFKGSWLSEILLLGGAEVIGYALPPEEGSLFTILGLERQITNHYADIRDLEKLRRVMEEGKPEIVFHLAAQPIVRESYEDPIGTFKTNIIGTANLLEAIRETSVKVAIIITTDKVYENKEWVWPYREEDELGGYDPYSASKACTEFVTRSYTRSFFNPGAYGKSHLTLIATARAGNVIGGGDWAKDRLVPDLVKAVLVEKKTLVIRSPRAVRPWQHVLEPLRGYLMLAERMYRGDTDCVGAWNFGPEHESFKTVKELVEKAFKIMGEGALRIEPSDKHEANILKLDITKAMEKLGWQPVLNFDESLQLTFKWYKAYYTGEDVKQLIAEQIKEYFDGTRRYKI